MITKLITAPAVRPVSQIEMDEHLRGDTTAAGHTLYVEGLIKSAVSQVENLTGRALITQTWAAVFNSWPEMVARALPYGRLQSVSSIQYRDEVGSDHTVSTGDYLVAGAGTDEGRVVIPSDGGFGYPDLYEVDPIVVTFVCGYGGPADVPEQIKTAIKLLVSEVYEDVDLSRAVNAHLMSYKLWSL